ncbi:MAG: hypothetical protein HY298_17255 [Verrucomicrobia bacterium]|nr:hypothetical protein [Verrucomicrobiota bacterium]
MKCFFFLFGALLASWVLAGCQSPPPAAEGSLAWVEIDGRTGAEIRQATVEVFKDESYRLKTNTVLQVTFEKPGGAVNNLAYGGWDSGVTIRVIVHVNVQNNGSHLLHCTVFRVRDPGDRSVEEARPIHLGRGPYQELLKRVKEKLRSGP